MTDFGAGFNGAPDWTRGNSGTFFIDFGRPPGDRIPTRFSFLSRSLLRSISRSFEGAPAPRTRTLFRPRSAPSARALARRRPLGLHPVAAPLFRPLPPGFRARPRAPRGAARTPLRFSRAPSDPTRVRAPIAFSNPSRPPLSSFVDALFPNFSRPFSDRRTPLPRVPTPAFGPDFLTKSDVGVARKPLYFLVFLPYPQRDTGAPLPHAVGLRRHPERCGSIGGRLGRKTPGKRQAGTSVHWIRGLLPARRGCPARDRAAHFVRSSASVGRVRRSLPGAFERPRFRCVVARCCTSAKRRRTTVFSRPEAPVSSPPSEPISGCFTTHVRRTSEGLRRDLKKASTDPASHTVRYLTPPPPPHPRTSIRPSLESLGKTRNRPPKTPPRGLRKPPSIPPSGEPRRPRCRRVSQSA